MQSHMPLGYKMINGNIEIDDKQAKTVKAIFEEYIKGKSMLAIAKELTEKGILNANKKTNWNHGSVGKILQNVKYMGETYYPKLIDESDFEKVQIQRKEREIKLGRTTLQNTMKKQSVFNRKIFCGECGAYYKVYAEHAGKKSEKKKWKCKKYLINNKVNCRNLFYTNEELKDIFIDAVNELIQKKWMLEKNEKKEPLKMSFELRQTESRIKELEQEEEYSSTELALLIFKRAELMYNCLKVDDYKNNTEKIKVALQDKKIISEFDEELFETIIKHITVYQDAKVEVEFINGIIIKMELEYKRKDEKDGSSKKDGSNHTATN
ncbi:recombinase family protein [Aminipila sp.]|uniref:recombinase family protein n=1 Tax=Aminipila sp. TaxID=2060095 RepID=UPI0028A17A5D|nr:recombinase family protein [Aminipila sp.]